MVALTALADDVPIETEEIDILVILDLLVQFEDMLISHNFERLDDIAIGQFIGRVERALSVDGILVFAVVL
jgi:hypothetical protein